VLLAVNVVVGPVVGESVPGAVALHEAPETSTGLP
jgi:hypothetical protein